MNRTGYLRRKLPKPPVVLMIMFVMVSALYAKSQSPLNGRQIISALASTYGSTKKEDEVSWLANHRALRAGTI